MGDREVREQAELLVDDADAELVRASRRRDVDLLAVDLDPAGCGFVVAGEDLQQRRLSGTVLADEPVDRAALDNEVDTVQGQRPRKALRHLLSRTSGGAAPGTRRFLVVLAPHRVTAAREAYVDLQFRVDHGAVTSSSRSSGSDPTNGKVLSLLCMSFAIFVTHAALTGVTSIESTCWTCSPAPFASATANFENA